MAKKIAKKTASKKVARKTTAKPKPQPATKQYSTRSDLGSSIDPYFEKIENDDIRAGALAIRDLIRKALPKADEAIKWGHPCWTGAMPVCAIASSKKHCSLQFFEAGVLLDDPKGLLEGTGKGCRHIKVRSPADIKKTEMTRMVKDANKIMTSLKAAKELEKKARK